MSAKFGLIAAAGILTMAGVAPMALANTAHVSILNFAFTPSTTSTVYLQGQIAAVEFRNFDAAPHQATSFATEGPVGAPQGTCINSPAINHDETFVAVIPPTPGCIGQGQVIEYFCAIHPAMRGTVIVRIV